MLLNLYNTFNCLAAFLQNMSTFFFYQTWACDQLVFLICSLHYGINVQCTSINSCLISLLVNVCKNMNWDLDDFAYN